MHFKTRKWYKRVIFHLIDIAVVNSWLLYRRLTPGCTMQLGKFKLSVATGLIQAKARAVEQPGSSCSEFPTAPKRRLPVKASSVMTDVRYDQVGHFPRQDAATAQRCKMTECKRKSTYICQKCKVNLCIDGRSDCFFRFHNDA
ncbi:hypothetical protein HPB47_022323 [Ixodes persulcatus]|uniref:Uncharacterized protein n=1 Tax=Ixodes persulcatus TaxID=34615 RepID=A0AC60QA15_IXOPE|nr:hypothetical protein HPB47_022323 [Ixodes persulcatus]